MITVHSTLGCGQTPRLAFALEELGLPWQLVWHEDGYFQTTHGVPGPLIEDGDLQLIHLQAILRYLGRVYGEGKLLPSHPRDAARVDQWLELSAVAIRGPFVALVAALREASADPVALERERKRLRDVVRRFEAALKGREYLTGWFSIADCALSLLAHLPRFGVELTDYPNVRAWLDRVTARPAWHRAQARLEAAKAPRP
jgi:glutathione S-transferase